MQVADSQAAADDLLRARVSRAGRLRVDSVSLLVAEEKQERLCEQARWDELLDEWRHQRAQPPQQRGTPGASASSPPHLRLRPSSPLKAGMGATSHEGGGFSYRSSGARSDRSSRRGGSSQRGGGGSLLSQRLRPYLRSGAEFPWVEQIAKDYGLEWAARQRATGIAREMAAAGYTAAQARTVVLGMLHGTQSRLSAAWSVFVPAGEGAVLMRAEWKSVLGLITGGMGMSGAETDQLFAVFDADGDGAIDFREFSQVLDALPLQRAVAESPVGSALSALQSMMVLRGQLLQRLTIDQLAAAGRIITRLRNAGFDDDQAGSVVQAVFLSRSRAALRDAWDVLVAAAAGDDDAASAGSKVGGGTEHAGLGRRGSLRAKRASKEVGHLRGGGSINLAQFGRLLPLLGDDLPLSRVERLFEEVDIDRSGFVEFDEFVLMVRRLKPKGVVKNNAEACAAAFESLTNVRSGRPKQLRRVVAAHRRAEAGSLLLTLRDLGYDDDQLLAILSAFYAETEADAKASHGDSPAHPTGNGTGAGSGAGIGTGSNSNYTGGNRLAPVRAAWSALGGGELVRLPANPFDFKKTMGGDAAKTSDATLALVAQVLPPGCLLATCWLPPDCLVMDCWFLLNGLLMAS